MVPGLPKVPPYFMLDAWRGIASLWVVMLHSCLPYVRNGHGFLLRNPIYQVSIRGQLGVTIFFVISGYCITGAAYNSISAQKPLVRFCLDRFRRIYPPYLIALLIASLLLWTTEFLRWQHVLPPSQFPQDPLPANAIFWLSNLTLTQALVRQPSLLLVAWSLCFEVAFYGIVACFLGAGVWWQEKQAERRLVLLAAGTGLFTCGSLGWLCVSPATCPFPLSLWYQFGFGALVFLCFAVDAHRPGEVDPSFKTGVRFALGAAFGLATVYAVVHAGATEAVGIPSSRVQAIVTMVFCGLLYVLRPHDARLLKTKGATAFMRLGAISYSLYLVHLPVFPFVDAGLRRIGFTGQWYFVPYLVQIMVAIAAGWAFFQTVERRFISGRQVRRLASE